MNTKPADLDLRIKAGAALTCNLSTRVGGAHIHLEANSSKRIALVTSFIADESAARPAWVRFLISCGFILAMALLWVLLLVDQLSAPS